MWDFNLPRLDPQEGSPEAQKIKDYLYQLTEQLRLLFNSIDVENLAPDLYDAYRLAKNIPDDLQELRTRIDETVMRKELPVSAETSANYVLDGSSLHVWQTRDLLIIRGNVECVTRSNSYVNLVLELPKTGIVNMGVPALESGKDSLNIRLYERKFQVSGGTTGTGNYRFIMVAPLL